MIVPSPNIEYVEVCHQHPVQVTNDGQRIAFMAGFTYFEGVRTAVEVAPVASAAGSKVYWRRAFPAPAVSDGVA